MLDKSQRALIIFGAFAVLLVIVALIANITNAPWLMLVVPVGYLFAQLVNRWAK